MKHLVVLTGAGFSAESGLRTFRDDDGLWNGYNVYDVATPSAFQKDPQMVLEFYNMRRRDVAAAKPNKAHSVLADLESHFNVSIITQNIDDLHERAGSSNVLHLHGEIFKKRSIIDEKLISDIKGDMSIAERGVDGAPERPHIVWFEEPVPLIEDATMIAQHADIFVIAGTSLQVYPAAGLLSAVNHRVPVYVIDKNIPVIRSSHHIHPIEKPATEGMQELFQLLVQ
jgi:NAD-dependent deacetylase